jgi:hypothetical protein
MRRAVSFAVAPARCPPYSAREPEGLMRVALLCLFVSFATSNALAQAQKIQRIDILEYGLYTADEKECRRDALGVQRCERTNVRHAVTTLTVPAQHGVQFGTKFRAVGTPNGATVNVKRVWLFPPAGLNSPASKQPLLRLDRDESVTIGKDDFTSYIFDDPWELVPGTWTLEYWVGDRKLFSKSFTVVAQ